MIDIEEILKPLPFISNRVWRSYTGGLLLDKIEGKDEEIYGPIKSRIY